MHGDGKGRIEEVWSLGVQSSGITVIHVDALGQTPKLESPRDIQLPYIYNGGVILIRSGISTPAYLPNAST